MRRFLTAVVIISFFFSSATLAASIAWQPYSPAVFKQAQKEKKLVLVFGKAEWCPWCRATRQQVFTDEMVIQVVNQYYIPVIVDVDQESVIAAHYRIRQLPTFVVLDASDNVKRSFAGYRQPQDLAAMLEGAALQS